MPAPKAKLPCGSCPWRVSNRDAGEIPFFDPRKAIGLLDTVGEGDDFRPVMACHMADEDDGARACRGYLARAGDSNLVVRLMALRGQIEAPGAVADLCDARGLALEDDYRAVLAKLLTPGQFEEVEDLA